MGYTDSDCDKTATVKFGNIHQIKWMKNDI